MSDPLSVAGTAAGIVSLGIQVCQGIISYYRSVEERKQELTGGLREVQNILSVFYSLNDILPQVDQRRSFDSHSIRECLKDSVEVLQKLQQLLVELRGSSTSSKIKGKMKETGRYTVYPFYQHKLTSLRQTLHGSLGNLNLAIAATSMKSGIGQETSIDTIKSIVETLHDSLPSQNNGIRDVHSQIRDNTEQLQSLHNTTTDIEHRLNRTEWSVRDLDQNIDSKLTVIQTSIDSNRVVIVDTLTQLINDKFEDRSTDIARMSVQLSQIANQGSNEGGHYPMRPKPSFGPTSFAPQSAMKGDTLSKETIPNAIQTRRKASSSTCKCPSTSRLVTYSYVFCGTKFQFEQRIPRQHRRGCKLQGINQKPENTYEVQFPLKMGWLAANVTRACIAFTTANSCPGISVRFKNIVREWDSPFYKELNKLISSLGFSKEHRTHPERVLRKFDIFERRILTMYKDGKTSPVDRDETGRSHAAMLIEEISDYVQDLWAYDSVAAKFLQLSDTLMELVRADNDKVRISSPIITIVRKMPQESWISMISRSIGAFEIHPGTVVDCILGGLDITRFTSDVPDLMDILGLEPSPIAYAIFSRSLAELERIVLYDPKAPMQRIFGLTTVQICAGWPEGLRLLLTTEAKSLIGLGRAPWQAPVCLAAGFGCIASVDLLMKAGCRWDEQFEIYFGPIPDEAMNCIASNIAERRWSLLRLAEQELAISQQLSPSCVPDNIAVRLCDELDDAGISIPPFLRVPRAYTTIYHNRQLSLTRFPIFFENGFQDCASYDDLGLTPVMIWRHLKLECVGLRRVFPNWLREQGLLDQKPKDPLNLGLNLHATGWHYIANMLSQAFSVRVLSKLHPAQAGLEWYFLNELSHVAIRDTCDCWCSPDGKGCSPLTSLWKTFAVSDRSLALSAYLGWRRISEFNRHRFFHDNNMFDMDKDEGQASALQLEFLRFLTFEALDMSHTCCILSEVDLENRKCERIPRDQYTWREKPIVLAYTDREIIKEIHSDDSEKLLLESLMDEFTEELERMGSSPKMLEKFLWGYWRRRMSELYSVDTDVVDDMEKHVKHVQTHVLPNRVLAFLGRDFDLLRFYTKKTPMDTSDDENGDDGSSVEDIDLSLPCRYCDGQEYFRDDSEDIEYGEDSEDIEDSGDSGDSE